MSGFVGHDFTVRKSASANSIARLPNVVVVRIKRNIFRFGALVITPGNMLLTEYSPSLVRVQPIMVTCTMSSLLKIFLPYY